MGDPKSGYMKNKGKTMKDMEESMGEVSGNYKEPKNPIDRAMEEEVRADEESRGITETLRNVWDAYTD